jgi:hypothetical protein
MLFWLKVCALYDFQDNKGAQPIIGAQQNTAQGGNMIGRQLHDKLSRKCQTLRTNASMLGVNIATLQTKPTVLSDDPSSLIKWYRSFA